MIVKGKSALDEMWRKNREELMAMLRGRMPAYLLRPGSRRRRPPRRPPVMVFHEIEPRRFEAQLRYLAASGYRGIDADELEALLVSREHDPRAIALTFDDGDCTFWSYGYPLLRRYGFKSILFVIPGLIADDETVYPNLDDLGSGRASAEQLAARHDLQPLCTWRELARMHEEGLVDIQSHSLFHYRVATGPKVVDLQHPGFGTCRAFPADLPLSVFDDPQTPARRLRLGAPVFANAPLFSARRVFVENPEMVRALTGFVAAHGGSAFFRRADWRAALSSELGHWPVRRRGDFESERETTARVRRELVQSKSLLEARLPGKRVRHFCLPWYHWSGSTVTLAAETGYSSLHGGLNVAHGSAAGPGKPLMIQRIPQEYTCSLPGPGRVTPVAVWRERLLGRRSLPSQPVAQP